jgi:hypothetical protein
MEHFFLREIEAMPPRYRTTSRRWAGSALFVMTTAEASLVACCGGDGAFHDLFGREVGNGPLSDAGTKLDASDSISPPGLDDGSGTADVQVEVNQIVPDAALGNDAGVAPPGRGNPPDAKVEDGPLDVVDPPVVSRDANDGAALDPAYALRGQRWEVKCTNGALPTDLRICSSVPPSLVGCPGNHRPVDNVVTFGGQLGTRYTVTLRLRGVIELKVYSGGTSAGSHFQIGGTGATDAVNVYAMSISSPAQTYYINADRTGADSAVTALDDTVTIPIDGAATIELYATDVDCLQLRNCIDPIAAVCLPYVIPGVSPAPAAFDGQFADIDVLSVDTR